jgi:hypothetical protein
VSCQWSWPIYDIYITCVVVRAVTHDCAVLLCADDMALEDLVVEGLGFLVCGRHLLTSTNK